METKYSAFLSLNPSSCSSACPHYDHLRARNPELRRGGSLITYFPTSLSSPPHSVHPTNHLPVKPSSALSPSEKFLPPSPDETGRPSQPSLTLDPAEQALQRLIDGVLPWDERSSVIESIFSSQRATDMLCGLRERDAQTSVDAIHEVRYHPSTSKGVG